MVQIVGGITLQNIRCRGIAQDRYGHESKAHSSMGEFPRRVLLVKSLQKEVFAVNNAAGSASPNLSAVLLGEVNMDGEDLSLY